MFVPLRTVWLACSGARPPPGCLPRLSWSVQGRLHRGWGSSSSLRAPGPSLTHRGSCARKDIRG